MSKVEITDEEPITFEENFSADDIYEKILTADKDYEITITFAPNRYEVSKTETENGSITINSDSVNNSILVDHGSDCDVVVTPNEGYSVSTVI